MKIINYFLAGLFGLSLNCKTPEKDCEHKQGENLGALVLGRIKEVNYDKDLTSCFHTYYTLEVEEYYSCNFDDNKKELYLFQQSGPLEDGGSIGSSGVKTYKKGDEFIFYLNHNKLHKLKEFLNCKSLIKDNYFAIVDVDYPEKE